MEKYTPEAAVAETHQVQAAIDWVKKNKKNDIH
jgi:hypothetical protein